MSKFRLFKGFIKVGCPVAAAASAGAAIAGSAGAAAPAAIPAAVALATSCGVVGATKQCDKIGRRKRSGEIEVEDGMIYYPISDDFDEFDDNDDGLIEYEEFAFDFLARWKFEHPEQLRIIFKDADTDDDGMLDKREFFGAPWDFGKYDTKVQKTAVNASPPVSTNVD